MNLYITRSSILSTSHCHPSPVDLGHLVRLERVRVLHLLAARLLADLPVHLRDAARRATAADEANRGVADLKVFFHANVYAEASKPGNPLKLLLGFSDWPFSQVEFAKVERTF